MTEESDLKRELITQCKKLGWYARRIEDQYAVGVLDVVIVPYSAPTLFVEGKVTDGLKFAPTPRQFIEGVRIIDSSGFAVPVLVGWRQKVMYVTDWATEAFITKSFKQPTGCNYAETLKEWLIGKQYSD